MPKGKDPKTADGLGGVHKVAISRQSAPIKPRAKPSRRL